MSNVDIPIFQNPRIKFLKIKIDEIDISLLVFCLY